MNSSSRLSRLALASLAAALVPSVKAGLAFAGLPLPRLWLLPFALAAVVLGHLARRRIRQASEPLRGAGLAFCGLALGYVQLGVYLLSLGTAVLLVSGMSALPDQR